MGLIILTFHSHSTMGHSGLDGAGTVLSRLELELGWALSHWYSHLNLSIKRISHSTSSHILLTPIQNGTFMRTLFTPRHSRWTIPYGSETNHWTRWTGDRAVFRIDAGPLAFGFSTENAWWGPGLRNSILMSNQAAGVPRAFLQTKNPIRTKLGAFEGLWILGRLQESDFFDQ